MSALKYIFAGSLTAIVTRARFINLQSRIRDVCRAFSAGFELDESIGDNFYTNSFIENDVTTINGFGVDSLYELYEDNVKSVISNYSYTSSLSEENQRILAASVNAILFAYTSNPNASLGELYSPIGGVLVEVSRRILGIQPFPSRRINDVSTIIHPFDDAVLTSLFVQNNYVNVYSQISTSVKSEKVDLVHYNWYDTTNLFTGPNYDKLKDAENQYYYLTGSLTYTHLPSGLGFCEEKTIQISTPTGIKTTTIYVETPCIDKSSYVGPVTGVTFYREFNDGPYSSGDFHTGIKKSFIDFDKSRLEKSEYWSNFSSIYSYERENGTGNYLTIYKDGIQTDLQGEYNLNVEYENAPVTTGILAKYQIMRVGDARIRSQCTSYVNGVCKTATEKLATGFKYALLELDPTIWENDYAYIITNPFVSGDRLLKRGLNLSSGVYKSVVVNNELIAANPDLIQGYRWYAGPPQLNETELPYFAFTQAFQSVNFPNNATITLYPAIGSSNGGVGGESSRSFTNSPIILTNSIDSRTHSVKVGYEQEIYPKAEFETQISSFSSDDDDIKLKVFGMGNAFSGKTIINGTDEENAGYFYSGYSFSGFTGSAWDLLYLYSGYRVGSRHNQIKFISGYSGSSNFNINKIYAHDGSGNRLEYYYFDSRLLPSNVSIQQTGWSEFSPIPSGVENSGFQPIYVTQNVENKQRYYKGPFATYENSFLYPNAKLETSAYDISNGFPTKFRYKVRVREETVKELYCKFKISDGFSYSTPIFTNVVRPTGSNFGVFQPKMGSIFSANGNSFDFNQWDISRVGFFYNQTLPTTVDNFYAPNTDSFFDGSTTVYFRASGKNQSIYKNQPTFKQGILITGDDLDIHRSYSGNIFRASGKHWYTPASTAVGLYHGFTGYEFSGFLTYNKPIFNLQEGIVDRVRTLQALPAFNSGCVSYKYCNPTCTESKASGINNLYTKDLNGRIFYSNSGNDPFFFKDMGGRRGTDAETQGGYHPKNIIGDNWVGFSADTYGFYCSVNNDVCDDNPWSSSQNNFGVEAYTNDNRIPSKDNRWFFIESKPNETKIYSRALQYNPMVFDSRNTPFSSASSTPNVLGGSITFSFDANSKSFYFDLNSIFPKRTITGVSDWYVNPSSSGIGIGPFDRNVEFFINTGKILTGYNSFYINQRRLSDFSGGTEDGTYATCSAPKWLSGNAYDDEDGNLFRNIRSVIFIPSGEVAILNVHGTGVVSHNHVGFDAGSYIHIRARQVLNECEYDAVERAKLGIRGSDFWLHNHNMINNGMEKTFSITNPSIDIASLEGNTYTYITHSRTGVLFPIPDASEYETYRVLDSAGNETYKISDMEDFYQKKTAKDNSTMYYSGWREGSRISFQFVEVEPILDNPPYERHLNIIPSGNCVIRGEMGYLTQADNAIFSEGIYLKDETPNDIIRDEFYGPSFVSDILKRVPQFTYPSGDFIHPVLEAPSVMKQRAGAGKVTPEAEFSGLFKNAPYNYNKMYWPALSDLRILNPEETLEELPLDDGNTFLNSTPLISAAQGQRLPNGKFNPNTKKTYIVRDIYQMYDSLSTDAIINSGIFLTNTFGKQVQLNQPESGVLVPQGTTLTEVISNLI